MLPFLEVGSARTRREKGFNLRRRRGARRLDAVDVASGRAVAPSVGAGQDQGHPPALLHGVPLVEQGGP